MVFDNLAPIRNINANMAPWRGSCGKKPWDYRVTAVVPVIDTVDMLEICIGILREQTEKPYILVVDTGSSKTNLNKILDMSDEDLEVHSIRLNGVMHPSDPVCMAMDAAQSMCRTEYMFATHSDCFLMRRDFIEDLVEICGPEEEGKFPVVGYEMSPRSHQDWVGMISHTATMYHMRTMDKIGFGWSMRRLASMYDLESHEPNPERPNWPDTEILGNLILRQNEVRVKIIGKEDNFQRNKDSNIDHCRSVTLGFLYSPEYRRVSAEWTTKAMEEATERLNTWRSNPQEENERIS
jgi:hypothetical protein